eukprot:4745628-Heterocapsa_arctica.AAC.1
MRKLDDAPSQEEQQAPYVTHLPRAAWCIICALAASSKADLNKVNGFEMGTPKERFDYTYMKYDGGHHEAEAGKPCNRGQRR